MSCAYTRPRYQVSVNRTIGPLVLFLPTFFNLDITIDIGKEWSDSSNNYVQSYGP